MVHLFCYQLLDLFYKDVALTDISARFFRFQVSGLGVAIWGFDVWDMGPRGSRLGFGRKHLRSPPCGYIPFAIGVPHS